jgi:hypothetical protein
VREAGHLETIKPVYLFADNRLLFHKQGNRHLLASLEKAAGGKLLKVAYVIATRDDDPEDCQIFTAAMEAISVTACRQLFPTLPPEDMAFLNEADVIVLAGKDMAAWECFKRHGLGEILVRRYHEGVLLMGISTGALQLGWQTSNDSLTAVHTFKIVPLAIGVGEEQQDWQHLVSLITELNGEVRGIGIPSGGGVVFHGEDNGLEPLRLPITEFIFGSGGIIRNTLIPGHIGDINDSTEAIN